MCAIAVPEEDNGWVVVTSRQGQPRVCSRMKSDQELVLEPLYDEDGMVALWRQSLLIETREQSDGEIVAKIKKLEGDNRVEYCALMELCADKSEHALGGLPLALVHAGSFIARQVYIRKLSEVVQGCQQQGGLARHYEEHRGAGSD